MMLCQILLLSLFGLLARAQAALPVCGQACLNDELGKASDFGCASTDTACLCRNTQFTGDLYECADEECGEADTLVINAYFNNMCAEAINRTATSTSATINSASTASNTATPSPSSSGPADSSNSNTSTNQSSSTTGGGNSNSSTAGGLSTGAKIGIGIGVPLAVILILIAVYFAFLSGRKRGGRTQNVKEGAEESGIDSPSAGSGLNGAALNGVGNRSAGGAPMTPEDVVQPYMKEPEDVPLPPYAEMATDANMAELGGRGVRRDVAELP